MIVIGLTGGIGTGKSVVSRMLEEKGAALLDADLVGHEAYSPGTACNSELVAAFGLEIVDDVGRIDRKRLGAIVFADAAALQRLNSIVHPRMYRMIEQRLEAMRGQGIAVVVLEAAILIEARWTPLVDQVWVVTAPEEVVVRRVAERNNLTHEQVRARVRAQMSEAERIRHADVVIDNGGTLSQVQAQVEEQWEKIRG